MKKIIKIKESDLQRIVKRVLNETHLDGKGKMRGMSIPKKDKIKIDNYIKQMNKTNKVLSADLDVNNTYLRFIQNILCTYSKEDKGNID